MAPAWLHPEAFDDPEHIIDELATVGACSVRVLADAQRERLLEEARAYEYTPREEVVGQGEREVRQQLATFDDPPPGSVFAALRDELETALERSFEQLADYPFESRLRLDELVLQRYPEGSIGITPHRDRSAYVNLVCVVTLAGRARFYVAVDRSGRQARSVDARPGSAVLMRAPGFRLARRRPFHAVDRVEGPRYVVALRQRAR